MIDFKIVTLISYLVLTSMVNSQDIKTANQLSYRLLCLAGFTVIDSFAATRK